MQALSEHEITSFCRHQPDWRHTDAKLVRDWQFADFLHAMTFVNRVADLAEQAGHHPDIDIRYNQVRLGLVTHDAGGITARDLAMATHLSETFGA